MEFSSSPPPVLPAGLSGISRVDSSPVALNTFNTPSSSLVGLTWLPLVERLLTRLHRDLPPGRLPPGRLALRLQVMARRRRGFVARQ